MNFSSDNVSPICPEILSAIAAESESAALPYGADDKSQQLDAAFSELFGTEVAVVPVATGTAANLIGLSGLVSPFGGVVCHHRAHINMTESTGVAFYGGGAKLLGLDGPSAKIEAATLDAYLTARSPNGMHSVDPECVAITQTTEFGTVYTVDEVHAIGSVCQKHDMRLFMDGARFANAVAALECHPADITWKAGVDVLSFGRPKTAPWRWMPLSCLTRNYAVTPKKAASAADICFPSTATLQHSFWPMCKMTFGCAMRAMPMMRQ